MHTTTLLIVASAALIGFGCSVGAPKDDDRSALDGAGGDGFNVEPDTYDPDFAVPDTAKGPCKGLQCQQVDCPGGTDTTITGTIYAPNGTLPLYNVIVYVPNAEVLPLPKGVQCDKCGAVSSGEPVVTALTDHRGQFELKRVPVGKDIPLVIQLGKWRRQIVVPEVKPCETTKLTDKEKTRLPKKRSEGDMPRVAITTGGCDKLACMLPKVGIDSSEFGIAGEDKAVIFYAADGSGPTGAKHARTLWNDLAELKKYDMAVFSCECYEATGAYSPVTKEAASFKAVTDYLAAGGRVFTTDFQYTWYKFSPDPNLQAAATITGGAPTGTNPVKLVTTFPKGKALADWLKYVDPASTYGEVKAASYVFANFAGADSAKTQTWANSAGELGSPSGPRFLTINTPVGKPVEAQCGKAVHLDAHINMKDTVDETFPGGCKSPIAQAEEAFAFFFFDLSSCIQKEGEAPKPPAVR